MLSDGFDVVVDFMIYNTEEFKKRAKLMLDSCKQYVYLSSSRVYSDHDDVITEDTPRLLDVCKDEEYLSTDEYALTKAYSSGRYTPTVWQDQLDDYPSIHYV